MEVTINYSVQRPPSVGLLRLFSLVFLFALQGQLQAAPPVLSEAIIADVTDRSFSLIWTSDQQGLPIVEMYSDVAGAVPVISGITYTAYDIHTGNPAFDESSRLASVTGIKDAAKSLGIIKVTTTGLNLATEYFVKFGVQVESTMETTLCPDAGISYCPDTSSALLSFTTEQTPVRTTSASRLFTTDILLELKVSARLGELLILNAETANYPVSAFVGDGVSVPYAILDLNNLYSSSSSQSLLLAGSTIKTFGDVGEGLVVRHYKGVDGSETGIQVAGVNLTTGALMTPIGRDYGDCNNDGRVDGYDHMLLENVVAGVLPTADYSSVAFHPVLCNLYKESGLNSVATSVVIDIEDGTRLEALLIGKLPLSSLPEAP